MPTGEQVTLQPALALVLGEDLHHLALAAHRVGRVGGQIVTQPLLGRGLVDGLEPVGRGLVRAEHAEVGGVPAGHLGEELTQAPGRLDHGSTVAVAVGLDGEVAEVRHDQVLQQLAPVRDRVGRHPPLPGRTQHVEPVVEGPTLVEQLLGPVAGQPVGQHLEVLLGVPGVGQGHLVAAPVGLGLLAVHARRSRPALRRPEHDHRPAGPLDRVGVDGLGVGLDRNDPVQHVVQQPGEPAVRLEVVVTGLRLEEVTGRAHSPASGRRARRPGSGPTRSGWRSCSRSGAAPAARHRRSSD